MPRTIFDVPPTPGATPAGGRCYDVELLTPLFGGGVATRVNDPSLPIRTTSIRGQLQFWWRATVGAQYATAEELRAAQSAVWGSTERRSPVTVLVENVKLGPTGPCARFEPDNRQPGMLRAASTWNSPFANTAIPYALFPFQGKRAADRRRAEVEPASCVFKALFRLRLQ